MLFVYKDQLGIQGFYVVLYNKNYSVIKKEKAVFQKKEDQREKRRLTEGTRKNLKATGDMANYAKKTSMSRKQRVL